MYGHETTTGLTLEVTTAGFFILRLTTTAKTVSV